MIGDVVGGYRIVELIGRGGMGEVYRAVQHAIGAEVAIKVLSHTRVRDPEVAERFIAEARISNLVRHDGLVNVIGLGVLDDGRPYQLMEYLIGASLGELIARHGALPIGTLCGWLREALRALTPLHARGVVHRDVKPSNLFVTASGRLKVLDFGIAKLLQPDGRNLTRTGHLLGTPEYMAPEQAAGEPVDHRADLFALGVVLFEGATAKRPFEGRLIEALAVGELPPSARGRLPAGFGAAGSSVIDALDAVIRTAMAPDPAKRFASAAAMEAALAALIDVLGPLGPQAFAAVDLVPQPGAPLPSTATLVPAASSTVVERPRHGAAVEAVADAAGPPIDIPLRLGRYAVERVIGRGGSGVVLLGFDPTVERRVALKLLDAAGGRGRRERLIAEAQAMARVNHPNVLGLHELGNDGDRRFLALEYVEGSDLARWLAAADRPWRAVVDMFAAAGRGLAAAHDAGVVHRDFKPSNVLVGGDGRPRVGDFGLADAGDGAIAGGTPAYMAPEQLEGIAVDARADQFAFAAALWEALHGELPYPGDSATAVALAARRGELRAPAAATVPASINAALRRALSATPADRFASMQELLTALVPASSLWRRWIAVAGAGFAVAAAIAAVAFTRGHGHAGAPLRTLAQIRALDDPGEVLRSLDALDDATLATQDARRLALAAAARGPTTQLEEPGTITALALADGKLVAASAAGFSIRDLPTGELRRLPAIPGEVRALRVMPDHLRVLVRDGIAKVPLDGSPASSIVSCSTVTLATVPSSATGDLTYIACPYGTALLDVLDHRRAVHVRVPLDQWIGFSSDGRRGLITHDGYLEIYDLATGAVAATRAIDEARAVDASADLCAIAGTSQLAIWNLASNATAVVALPRVDHLAIAGGLVIAATEHEVAIYDADGKRQQRWQSDTAVRGLHVTGAGDGLRVVIEGTNGLVVKDIARDRELVLPGAMSLVAPGPDGAIAVANGTQLRLWHTDLVVPWSSWLPVTVLESASAFQTSFDGRWAAYGDGPSLRLLDLTTRAIRTLDAHHPISIVFSPDDRRMAAVDDHGGVRSWLTDRFEAPRELGTLDGRLGFLRIANDGALQISLHKGPIVTLEGGRPCGPEPAIVTSPRYALLRSGDTTVLCEVGTGRRWPLAIAASGRMAMTDRLLTSVEADRVRLFEIPAGTEVALPDVRVDAAWLDDGRVLTQMTDGRRAWLPARGAAPVELAGSHGAEVLQSFGAQLVGVLHHELCMWDVRQPDVRDVVGRTASSHAARVFWSEATRSILSFNLAAARSPPTRFLMDVWPTEAASVADVRRWAAAVRAPGTP